MNQKPQSSHHHDQRLLGQQYLGTLTEINDDDYLLNYFEKGRKKKVTIKKEDVLKTQLRVKI